MLHPGHILINIRGNGEPLAPKVGAGGGAEAQVFSPVQYFRLCRDRKPRRAKLEISYWA